MKTCQDQIQIDPFHFRQYLIYFQMVNACSDDLNRTAVKTHIKDVESKKKGRTVILPFPMT